MNTAALDAADLQQALDGRFPYHLLSAPLQQRLSQQEYYAYTVKYGISRWYAYHRLPDFVKPTVTEAAYYEAMVRYGGEQSQLYPYAHQQQVLLYTGETPLTYYVRMIGEMLKAERSYDRLPNFTANDVLNLLGIGRNQYLNLTKDVRSKLRWHVNRAYVSEHLPTELLPSVTLDPFWVISPVVQPPSQQAKQQEQLSKLSRERPEDAALFRLLVSKGSSVAATANHSFSLSSSFAKGSQADQELLASMQVDRQTFASEAVYACQAPRDVVHRLYHKSLVCGDFTVSPEDFIIVPPLENFVMNRTSEEPLELLLYRVLSTLDDRTPLQLLAQLLMVPEEDVCAAVHALIRLGLARKKTVQVPLALSRNPASVHPSWQSAVASMLPSLAQEGGPATASSGLDDGAACSAAASAAYGCCSDNSGGSGGTQRMGSEPRRVATVDGDRPLPAVEPPRKRIALLYDATLTGFLMMTNLSRDPLFKQHAVTLFEVGKMPDEVVGSFLELLEKIDPKESKDFGGEAQKYMSSAISLRELLKVLRSVRAPDSDAVAGVDMLKIESLNELEATTRYSVLGRNYWAYVTTAPIATAPLIDVELSCVYGNTASLMASPWLLLFLYERTKQGPPTLMLPFGSQLHCWPPEFVAVQEPPSVDGRDATEAEGYAAKVRLQTIALDAEVSHADVDTSLILVNTMSVTAPVVVQCVAPVPLVAQPRGRRDAGAVAEQPGCGFLELTLPFTATAEEVQDLLNRRAVEVLAERTAPKGSCATADAQAAAPTVSIQDDRAQVYAALKTCVDALQLHDSLGYITCCVSFHAIAHVAVEEAATSPVVPNTISPAWGSSFAVDRVEVVGLGLGLSLTHRDCCSCALRSLPRLLSEECSERHNAAMRACVEAFSAFLERYSTLTCATYSKLALRSAAITGPMTQQHLRKVGGGGPAPFPASTIVFTGKELRVIDDADPLSEQWST